MLIQVCYVNLRTFRRTDISNRYYAISAFDESPLLGETSRGVVRARHLGEPLAELCARNLFRDAQRSKRFPENGGSHPAQSSAR